MWPFRRRSKEPAKRKSHLAQKVIAGLIIGGAISSIIGKKLLEKTEHDHDEEEKTKGKKKDGEVKE